MGPGNEHLGPPGTAADLHHVYLYVLALHQLLGSDLLAGGQHGLRGLRPRADAQGYVSRPGVHAADYAGEDLVLLGVELVIDHAPLGLPQALDNDLLAVSGGNAAKLHVVHRDIDDAAYIHPAVLGPGLLGAHLGAGIFHFLHDFLLDVHPQVLLGLVHVYNHVLHALVVFFVGCGQSLDNFIHHEGGGNAPLLLQHIQRDKNLITFHVVTPIIFHKKLLVPSKFNSQAAQSHLILPKGHGGVPHGDGHVPVIIARQRSGELLPPVSGLIELHRHRAAYKPLEVPGPLQGPLRPGGGYLQGVAALNGVRLVQQVAEGPADLLAVQNVHAALLINIDPQKPSPGLPDVLHIP